MGVTSFLLVSCLGLAITAQAQDCSKPASGPNMSLRDDYIVLESFPDGTRVSFQCDIGYTAESGSPHITCTAGSWSRLSLKCERKSCGALDEKPNTLYDYSEGIQFGDKVVITCKEGYRMPGAEQKREMLCGDKGWMGRQPECEVVVCDPPPAIVGGSYNPTAEYYNYRDVLQYTCHENLALNGSKARTCSQNATFTPAAPTCVRVECKEPVITNGEWIDGSRPPHKYKASVTYRCREGFKMEGSPHQMCEINSEWSPGLPTCKQLPTTTPTTTTTTTTTPPTDNVSSPTAGIIAGIVVLLLLLLVIIIIILKKKRGRKIPVDVADKERMELSGGGKTPVDVADEERDKLSG